MPISFLTSRSPIWGKYYKFLVLRAFQWYITWMVCDIIYVVNIVYKVRVCKKNHAVHITLWCYAANNLSGGNNNRDNILLPHSQHGQEWGRALGSCHEGRSGQRRQWHSRHSGSHYSGFVPVLRVIDILYCRQQTLVTPSPHALINFITMLKLQTQQSIGGTTISLSNQRVICKTIAKINL